MFKTVICTIVYSRTWYIWWKKNILPISNLFGNLLTKFNCNFFVFTYVMYATRGRFLLLHPFLLFLLSNFWQVFCKSYWNSELIFKGPNLRSLFLSKYAMNFINIYMSNYPNISGYMSPPISSYTLPPFSKSSPPNQISMKVCDICTSIKSGIFKAFKIVAR